MVRLRLTVGLVSQGLGFGNGEFDAERAWKCAAGRDREGVANFRRGQPCVKTIFARQYRILVHGFARLWLGKIAILSQPRHVGRWKTVDLNFAVP